MATAGQPPSPPPDTPSADGPRPSRASLAVTLVAAAVVFAVAVAVTVAVRRSTAPDGYTDADRATFVDACLAGGGEPMRSTCECTWDGIVAAIPPERYHELDAAARTVPLGSVAGSAGSLPAVVPAELEGIVATCLARHVLLPAAGSSAPTGAPGSSTPVGPATSVQSSADDPTTAPSSSPAPSATLEFRPDTTPPA